MPLTCFICLNKIVTVNLSHYQCSFKFRMQLSLNTIYNCLRLNATTIKRRRMKQTTKTKNQKEKYNGKRKRMSRIRTMSIRWKPVGMLSHNVHVFDIFQLYQLARIDVGYTLCSCKYPNINLKIVAATTIIISYVNAQHRFLFIFFSLLLILIALCGQYVFFSFALFCWRNSFHVHNYVLSLYYFVHAVNLVAK